MAIDPADIQKVSRGLASAYVVDYVGDTRRRTLRVALLFVIIDIALIVWGPTWLKWLGVFGLITTVIVALLTLLVSAVTVRTVRRFAEPQDLSRHREALSSAIDRAEFPTGPISGLKLAWRLRKGTGAEFERLSSIVGDLVVSLDDS